MSGPEKANLPDGALFPLEEDARFPVLMAAAEDHWERHNPKLFHALQEKGTLQQALGRAVEATLLSLHQSERAGLSPDRARELAYPNWQLPDEKDSEKPESSATNSTTASERKEHEARADRILNAMVESIKKRPKVH